MAKTYKELAADIQGRRSTHASKPADMTDRKPSPLESMKSVMSTKAEAVSTAIEAKLLLEDHMMGNIEDAEFAYQLAQDGCLRKTMTQLTEQILQPTPVESRPFVHKNSFINIGAGLSAYWTEMQKKLPIEIDEASQVENILMSVNAGLDRDLEPDTRKIFFKEAGMTSDQIKELVPLSEYAEYESKVKDTVRSEVASELGLEDGRELTEEEQLLIDSMTEDRMMSTKLQTDTDGTEDAYSPTYEDTYGISAQDMFEMFSDPYADTPSATQPENGEQIPLDDPSWEMFLEQSGAQQGYQDMMDATVESNMEMLRDLEAQAELSLTDEDLSFGNAQEMDYGDVPDFGINDADLAFAAQYAEDDYGIES